MGLRRALGNPAKQSKFLQAVREGHVRKLQVHLYDSAGDNPASLELLWEVLDPDHLEQLQISMSQAMHSLPQNIGSFQQLTVLNLSGCQIRSLPESIGNCTELNELILLSCDCLRQLPSSIVNLVNLAKLDLYATAIHTVPESVASLRSLTYLSLGR